MEYDERIVFGLLRDVSSIIDILFLSFLVIFSIFVVDEVVINDVVVVMVCFSNIHPDSNSTIIEVNIKLFPSLILS